MNLRQSIIAAAKSNDLDQALSGIQSVLGVTTGDLAGQMFGSVGENDPFNDEYWP